MRTEMIKAKSSKDVRGKTLPRVNAVGKLGCECKRSRGELDAHVDWKLRNRDGPLIAHPNEQEVRKHADTATANLTQSHEPNFQVAEYIAKGLVYRSLMTRQVQISIEPGKP